jgi:putative molybdopterin biosynthesis protein
MTGAKVFRELISVDEALNRLASHYTITSLEPELVDLRESLGRVLAEDVFSPVDVPPFDRASMDGFAVRAADTFSAEENRPVPLKMTGVITPGQNPNLGLNEGETVEISTGAVLPKGANAVVMTEYADRKSGLVSIYRSVVPGENVMSAGSDMMLGELVLRRGVTVTPREMGILAAIGAKSLHVHRKPSVAILSTGNELRKPGDTLNMGEIYDANSFAIAGAVSEDGGEPKLMGIVKDNLSEMKGKIIHALESCHIVVTSGSTSAGSGDVMYRILDELGEPGVIVHGLSVKPGKPAVLAVIKGKPVFGLPGYPSSAMMIFKALVSPVIRTLAGLRTEGKTSIRARMAQKIFSSQGRREYLPVQLVSDGLGGHTAFPIETGSGAVTSFSLADGFIEVPENVTCIFEGEEVPVELASKTLKLPNLVILGSHCLGVDTIIAHAVKIDHEFDPRVINTGSVGGFRAIAQGQADLAGVHILDEVTGRYNIDAYEKYGLRGKAFLLRGYDREQGLITAKGNPKSIGSLQDLLRDDVAFMNRNAGSGTRILLDMQLRKLAMNQGLAFERLTNKIRGYAIDAKSHSAVAAAVKQGKADVGLGIRTAAHQQDLDFIHLWDEKYDFLVNQESAEKPPLKTFIKTLKSKELHEGLLRGTPGLRANRDTGSVIYPPNMDQ